MFRYTFLNKAVLAADPYRRLFTLRSGWVERRGSLPTCPDYFALNNSNNQIKLVTKRDDNQPTLSLPSDSLGTDKKNLMNLDEPLTIPSILPFEK